MQLYLSIIITNCATVLTLIPLDEAQMINQEFLVKKYRSAEEPRIMKHN